jgi:hypothetical protein
LGLLSTLLPGLRDLRAPLAAGYLWLAALWLVCGSRITDLGEGAEASFASRNAHLAWDYMGRPGQAVALTFAAYIVGSAATDFTKGTVGSLLREMWAHALLPGATQPSDVVSKGVKENLALWLRQWETDHPEAWDFLLEERIPTYLDIEPEAIRKAESERAADQLLGQIETLRTQLLRSAPVLAEELDRRRAEGEFRIAVGFPLVALVGIAAVASGIAWLTLLVVVPLVAATRIIGSGRRRMRSANDDLIELMTIAGVMSWPKLDEAIRRGEQRAT